MEEIKIKEEENEKVKVIAQKEKEKVVLVEDVESKNGRINQKILVIQLYVTQPLIHKIQNKSVGKNVLAKNDRKVSLF